MLFPGMDVETFLGGFLGTSSVAVEVDTTGKVKLAYGGVGKVYKDIETDAGRGLFVANDADAIKIMRDVRPGLSRINDMKCIVKWWDAGKPQGAALEALMKEVNDPLKPAGLLPKLDGEESISGVALRRPLHVCAATDQEPNNQEQKQKPQGDSTDPATNPPRVNAVPDPSVARGQTTAILTGAISIIFGVAYLALVQFMDMRGGELLPPPPEAFIP